MDRGVARDDYARLASHGPVRKAVVVEVEAEGLNTDRVAADSAVEVEARSTAWSVRLRLSTIGLLAVVPAAHSPGSFALLETMKACWSACPRHFWKRPLSRYHDSRPFTSSYAWFLTPER